MKSAVERANETLKNFDWYSLPEEKYRTKDGIAYEKCGCWSQMMGYGDWGKCDYHIKKDEEWEADMKKLMRL